MSSRDHLWSEQWNHTQLQMFMPARELIGLPFHEPDREVVDIEVEADGEWLPVWEGRLEDDDEFWERKLDESYHRYPSNYLYDKIAESGRVNEQVDVRFDEDDGPVGGEYLRIREGHHRIAAANEINPDMEVPINYYRYPWEGPATQPWMGT